MDQRIMAGLAALGLSEERIAEFASIVDGVKERIKADGLITRKRSPAAMPKPAVVPKAGKRTLRVTYKPTTSSGRTVADEIAMLEGRLKRDLPPWQRERYEARLDGLRRTGKGMAELARETLAHLPGATR